MAAVSKPKEVSATEPSLILVARFTLRDRDQGIERGREGSRKGPVQEVAAFLLYSWLLHRKCWRRLHSLLLQVKKSVRKQAGISVHPILY